MKKVLIGLLALCTIFLIKTNAFGADITSELIGKFSFDENVINDATGIKAEAVKPGSSGEIGIRTAGNWSYVDGVKGSAIYLSAPGYDPRGLDLGISPKDEENYTVSLWVKQLNINFVAPIVWVGSSVQKSPNWVGIMSYNDGYIDEENSGAILIGINRIKSLKVAPDIGKGLGYIKNSNYVEGDEKSLKSFDWTNITMVVDEGIGKLYYDGQLISTTGDIKVPDVLWDDTVSFYLGADAWNDIFEGYVDELYIYDRALEEEDIKMLISRTNEAGAELGFYGLDYKEGEDENIYIEGVDDGVNVEVNNGVDDDIYMEIPMKKKTYVYHTTGEIEKNSQRVYI